jgi:hypothetical protein
MHHSGERVDVGQFSRELVGDIVDDYMANAMILSKRRWAKLLKICSAQDPTKESRVTIPGSSMHDKRRNLYVRSSPVESDSEDE